MNQASPSPRRALAGLPPRASQSPPGVARLIRSNRGSDTDLTAETKDAEAPVGADADASALPASPQALTDSQTPVPSDSQSRGAPGGVSDGSDSSDGVAGGVPKYLRLMRREARMHADQVDRLAALTRTLNERRRGGGRSGVGERITDNTLVRVAVDLLLQRPDQLQGATEDELRASVGLPPLPRSSPGAATAAH